MALTKPKVGKTYVLTNPEGLGRGVGHVPTGTEVEVESLHKRTEAGVGGEVRASWVAGHVVVDGETVAYRRAATFSVADFNRLFSPKEKK